eukprot:m.327471 g.327471  ORF g.327471 m.327471 type:complete len:93 (-) comp16565_c0_seq47:303-581(-)
MTSMGRKIKTQQHFILQEMLSSSVSSLLLILFGVLVQAPAASAESFLDDTDTTTAFFAILCLVLFIIGMGITFHFKLLCFRPFRVDERGNII